MRKIVFCLAILAISIFITGCTMEDLGFEYEYTTGTGLSITKENYDKIKTGDSYTRIKSILGGACDNYYSSNNEDWYTCIDNKDSSKRIVLKFVNGKLEHKSSSGLN